MKYVVFALIGAVAAVMAYFFVFERDCGGQVVSGQSDCLAHFSPDMCRVALGQADRKARNDFPPFATQDACDRVYPRCMPHGTVNGFVPVPRSYCLVRSAAAITGTPIYQRYGDTVTYK